MVGKPCGYRKNQDMEGSGMECLARAEHLCKGLIGDD